jgi:hypothetical protein
MYGKTRTGIGLPPICDEEGILLTQALGGKYTDLVRRGVVFSAANQAAVATTAALATAWTGLSVGNPATSGKDIVLLEFGVVHSVALPAAGAVGLMYSDMTGLATQIVPVNAYRGHTNTSVAIADAGATIATPVLLRVFGQGGTVATSGFGLMNGLVVDLNGSIVLAPGQSILTYTTLANTAAYLFHFVWAELDRASDS